MATSSQPITFTFYRRFLQIKYLLILGFISGLVLISLFVPIVFNVIQNSDIWGWVLFGTSFTSFAIYYAVLIFFWQKGQLEFFRFRRMLIIIFSSIFVLLILQTLCLLAIYQVLNIKPRFIFFVFFPIATIAMFAGIGSSTKFFFTWQQTVFIEKNPKQIK